MTKIKRRFKYKSLVLFFVFMGMTAVLLVPIIDEIKTTLALKASLDEVNTKLKDLTKQNEALTLQRDKLLDTDYVISYARGVYMLSKDTEKVYYFKDDTSK